MCIRLLVPLVKADHRARDLAAQEAASNHARLMRYSEARHLFGDRCFAVNTLNADAGDDLCPVCAQALSDPHRNWLQTRRDTLALALISEAERAAEAAEAHELANRPEQKALMGGLAEAQAEIYQVQQAIARQLAPERACP